MTLISTSVFSTLSEHEQALVLARFAHQLTILARDGYEAGTMRLSDPELVRRINEVQHRITDAIAARLSGSTERYSDDALLRIIAGSESDPFSCQRRSLFRRAWKIAFGSELDSNSDK